MTDSKFCSKKKVTAGQLQSRGRRLAVIFGVLRSAPEVNADIMASHICRADGPQLKA